MIVPSARKMPVLARFFLSKAAPSQSRPAAKRIATFTFLFLAGVLCGGSLIQAAPPQDFENVPVDAKISSGAASGWTLQVEPGAEDSAFISEDPGNTGGKYLRLTQPKTVVAFQPDEPQWANSDGPGVFKLDFRFNGKMPADLTLHNGATSAGMYISINHRTNTVSLSQGGGQSVYRATLSDYPVPDLSDGLWYTLEIKDLTLSSPGGPPASGKLYLYEKDHSANVLLDGVAILAAGSNPFTQYKTLQIRRWGDSKSSLDVDNIRVDPAVH